MENLIKFAIFFLKKYTKIQGFFYQKRLSKLKPYDIHTNPTNQKNLRIFILGYLGTSNVGADMRVLESIRQINHIFKGIQVKYTIPTMNRKITEKLKLNADIVDSGLWSSPKMMFAAKNHDGIINCEGSMLIPNGSEILPMLYSAVCASANHYGKFSIGYGIDASAGSNYLKNSIISDSQKKTLLLCRHLQTHEYLNSLGLNAQDGTDSAWLFHGENQNISKKTLKENGWNGVSPIIAIAPQNGYRFPVKASLSKLITSPFLKHQEYKKGFYFTNSTESTQKYSHYIDAIVTSVENIISFDGPYFPILIGMEKMDTETVQNISIRLQKSKIQHACFLSVDYSASQIAGLIQLSHFLITSRYHAAVIAMSSCIPCIGIAIDKRISMLFHDLKENEFCINASTQFHADNIYHLLSKLLDSKEYDRMTDVIGTYVSQQVIKFGDMGIKLLNEIMCNNPHLSLETNVQSWQDCLPAYPKNIQNILEKYNSAHKSIPLRSTKEKSINFFL